MVIYNNPKYALSSAFLYRRSLETNLRLTREAGFENTELFLTRNIVDHTYEQIRDAFRESGLNMLSIHLPIPFSYNENWPDLESSIRKALEWAEDFDAQWVVSHPLVVMADADAELHEAVRARYFRILDAARALSGSEKLLIENMPKLGDGKPIKNLFKYHDDFIEMLDRTGFGMAFDTAHWSTFDTDIISGFRPYMEFVRNMHISDYGDGKQHIVPGDGEIDLDSFLAELNRIGYSEQLTLELDFTTRGRNTGLNEDGILQDLIRTREWMVGAFKGSQ
jgi:sugar phosphate isomerase/epimerase